jgi:hypothetical protein
MNHGTSVSQTSNTQLSLSEKLAAMHQRIQARQQQKAAKVQAAGQRRQTRSQAAADDVFRHGLSVIRSGDFSDRGYLVHNGRIPY